MAVVSRVRATSSGSGGSLKEVNCLAADVVGNCVYVSDDTSGGKWTVATADPTDDNKMPAVGVLVHKRDDTNGILQLFGACDLFTDMTPGQMVLVGTGGDVFDEVPSVPVGEIFWAQQIGVAAASDVLWISGNMRMVQHRG